MLRRTNERMESTLVIPRLSPKCLNKRKTTTGQSRHQPWLRPWCRASHSASWFRKASHMPKSLRYGVSWKPRMRTSHLGNLFLLSFHPLSPSLDVSMSFPILASTNSFLIAGFNTKIYSCMLNKMFRTLKCKSHFPALFSTTSVPLQGDHLMELQLLLLTVSATKYSCLN